MTFLPIVDRELRVASRKRGTYWTRALMGLAAIVLAALLQWDASSMPAAYVGKRIFGGLIWIALVYCLFAGRQSTADCLSSEKREGTLGLLFLTDLRGYDVVLGKLAATSLNGFYGLLAVLPVLALPLLLGGVSSGEFWRVVLVLVLAFLLSLAAGMLVSAMSRDARKALGGNLLLLICLVGIPPAIASAIAAFRWPATGFVAPLFYSCPIYTIHTAEAAVYAFEKRNYWFSVAVIHALTWAMLFLASLIVPHSWQDRTTGPGVRGWRATWHRRLSGGAAKRAAFRRRLLQGGAYYWLAARGRLKPVQVWILMAAIAGWWIWSQIKYGSTWQGDVFNPLNITTAVMMNSALKLWICIEAGRQLAEDRRSGAFELLLSTPLSPGDILRGQWRALIRQFFWPLLLVLAVEIMFMFHAISRPFQNSGVWPSASGLTGSQAPPAALWLAGMLMLLADIVALAQVAMWTALTARTANQASIGALLRILVIPWFVLWVVSASVSFSSAPTPGPSPEWQYFLGWWFWSGVAVDAVFGLTARFQLHGRFRELAVRPFALHVSGQKVRGGWG